MLTLVKVRQQVKGSTPELHKRETRLTQEIYDLKHPEMASIPTESLATRIGDKSDASTLAGLEARYEARYDRVNS
jgi:hypothetical protein